MSSLHFNLMIADKEEEMRKVRGEVILAEDKIYTLAYADDMALYNIYIIYNSGERGRNKEDDREAKRLFGEEGIRA